MKTIPVSLILFTLVGVGQMRVHAEGPGRPAGPQPDGGHEQRHREFLEVWNRVDVDRDGRLSPDEFAGMRRLGKLPADKRQRLFERLDKNGDGVLGREEIHQLVKHRPRGGMPRIWELDRDKDGGVTFDEFCQGEVFQKFDESKQKRIFNNLDSNGDGRITREDKPKWRPNREPSDRPKPAPGQWLERLDKDGDGKVSWEEFQAAGPQEDARREGMKRKRFERMDANGDGLLTAEEFAAMPRPDRRPPHGPHGPERP